MLDRRFDKKELRKYQVLARIVGSFIRDAAPVSSRAVTEEMNVDISSATVRNIMGELEDEGYISQPHVSAGRVPTHTGYRMYVNMMQDSIRYRKEQARRVKEEFSDQIQTLKEIIKRTSILLSRELHNAGIVLWPSVEYLYLKRLELIKIKAETVLAVLVTLTNAVENYIIKLDRDLRKNELERIANYINRNFENLEFSDILKRIKETLSPRGTERDNVSTAAAKDSLQVVDSILREDLKNKMYLGGLDFFLEEMELGNGDISSRNILRVVSEQKELVSLLRKELPSMDLRVYIGNENGCEVLRECAIVTGGYQMCGKTVGRIGVLGPVRMDYKNALEVVKCVSELVSSKLSEINK